MAGDMMRKNSIARLHIFPDEEVGYSEFGDDDYNIHFKVPEDIMENITAQIPQVKPVPKKLTDYSEAEKDNFPRLFEVSKDFVRK